MENQKIAVLSCVSFNLPLVKRQLLNYQASHGDNATHFLHAASDGDIDIDALKHIPNICTDVESSSFKTSNLCNFGGQIANSMRLKESSENFGYVYIHTDADLIVKGNLSKYINRHKCGFLKHRPHVNWPHYTKMMSDPCFKKIRDYLGIGDVDIYSGRQEGSFFPIDLWLEMSAIFEKFYPTDFFNQRHLLWPIEEGIVPSVAAKLISLSYSHISVPVTNIVVTKPLKPSPDRRNPREISENCVNIDDIQKTLSQSNKDSCIAMKWFSRDSDDAAAALATRQLNAL